MTGKPASRKRLGVLVDGTALPDEASQALWERFSAWMDENRGDLAGFAAKEGFASVHPGVDGDRPVLRASTSGVQRPYAPVRPEGDGRAEAGAPVGGGSFVRQVGPSSPDRRSGKRHDLPEKPRK